MAAPTPTPVARDRYDVRLRNVRLDVEAIPQLANEWAMLPDGERVSWSHLWDQDMGFVEDLVTAARRGKLDARQQQELLALVQRLGALSPPIAAMGLWLPHLGDWAPVVDPPHGVHGATGVVDIGARGRPVPKG